MDNQQLPLPSQADSIHIAPWAEAPEPALRLPEIEAIFFESAVRKTFASEAEREAFRVRWLARYLARYPDDAFVALGAGGEAVGYLIGCPDSAATSAEFADAGYGPGMAPVVAEISARYPAHLHINMRADIRGLGVGQRLIEAYADRLRGGGVAGVHVVTGAQSRAVGFYRKCGFEPLTETPWPAPGTLALGRVL
jgi:GNAT superfamily N-acetyltransferase